MSAIPSTTRIESSISALTGIETAGRMAGSAGAHHAARFITGELERSGVRQAGRFGYRSPVLVHPARLLRQPRLSIASTELLHRSEFGIRAVICAPGKGSGPLVVVRADDELDEATCRDAVVLLTESYPFDVIRELAEALRELGALALLTPEDLLEGLWLRKEVYVDTPILPVFKLAPEIARSAQALAGSLVEFEVAVDSSPGFCSNIIGAVDGTRPDRTVVLTAHYDHVGDDPSPGEHFPGAFDNASGVAVVLEVASRLATRRRRRTNSLLVALLTGEESGLEGSRQLLAERPTPPVAAVNIDGVGSERLGSMRIGRPSGRAKQLAAAAAISRRIVPQAISGRDDSRVFHHAGIPTIGLGQEPLERPMTFMHTPDDVADALDFDAISNAADFVLEIIEPLLDS